MSYMISGRLYGLHNVCKMTDLGLTTVKSLIHSGELESIKVGRRRLVPHESLHRFVEQRLASSDQDASDRCR